MTHSVVCGATNHVTRLAGPVVLRDPGSGRDCNTYLVKMTCCACITPNVIEPSNTHYDGVAAVGLVSAVRQSLNTEVEVLTVWGCNRQVSRWGESHWLSVGELTQGKRVIQDSGPYRPQTDSGVHIQLGAGGGGITQGPARAPK